MTVLIRILIRHTGKNGNIQTVIDGIKNISDARKKYNSSLKIEIQFLVNRFNEHQIPRIRKLAHEMNASLKFKSMQITSKNSFETWLPSGEKFRRYMFRDGTYLIKSSLPEDVHGSGLIRLSPGTEKFCLAVLIKMLNLLWEI